MPKKMFLFWLIAICVASGELFKGGPEPTFWDTTRIYTTMAGFRQIAIGNRLKGLSDDTFRIFTVQANNPRMVLLFTDISTAPPMQWRCDTLEVAPAGYFGARIGDVDRDGDNDLIYARSSSPYYLFRFYWDGVAWVSETIAPLIGANAGMAIGDADNDGNEDEIIYSVGTGTASRLQRAYWTGSAWQIDTIWWGDGRTIQGVAIGDFDNTLTGNEIVTVTAGSYTDGSRVMRLYWSGSNWDTLTLWKAVDSVSLMDVAIGDFDANNPGNEIAVGNSLTAGSQARGAVIEIYGSGTNWNANPIFIPTGSENGSAIAIGDILDTNPGDEVVSATAGMGPGMNYAVRAIYGSGDEWNNEMIFNIGGSSYGIAIGEVNKYRTLNQEIAVTGGGRIYEAEQKEITGPIILNVTSSPRVALSTEPVIIQAKIYDNHFPPLDIVDSLSYSLNDTLNWTWLTHDSLHPTDSIYFYTVPAQDTGSLVYFRLMAKNTLDERTLSSVSSYPVAYEHSIYTIQWTPQDTSPDFGKWVRTYGIVTGIFGRHFYIAENPGNAWHGLYVRRPQFSDTLPHLSIGDSVAVLGLINEYARTTINQVEYLNGGRITILAQGLPLPCTTLLAISQVAESLEANLVRLENVHFRDTGNFRGNTYYPLYNETETETIQVYIAQGIGIAGNPIPQGPISVVGLIYQSTFGFYQLNPRFYDDFVVLPGPSAPSLLSPPNGFVTDDTLPLFDWTDVATATQYHIQVDDDSLFLSPAIDNIVDTSQFQTITPLPREFTYYWRVRAGDQYNRWSVWSEVWYFTITTVGIEENPTIVELQLTIRPNPTRDKIYVYYTPKSKTPAILTIYNLLGEAVSHRKSDKGYFTIDSKKLGAGIYILQFEMNGLMKRQKLILMR
ncbi:MAG: T9SS type A sorting domain-containing protein [candidate division WOR-3 bacterium]